MSVDRDAAWKGREKDLARLFKLAYPVLLDEIRRRGVSYGDREDLAMETFWRVARKTLSEDRQDPSPAYLRTAAKWAVTDHFRWLSRQPVELDPMVLESSPPVSSMTSDSSEVGEPEADLESILRSDPREFDSIGDMIRTKSAFELLDRTMARARHAGDRTTFRVAAQLIDISETEGTIPSNRRIAKELGLSHVAVGKALARFKNMLLEERRDLDRTSPPGTP